MNTKDDKFILGGHEFTSRFILGSGKFSLDLVKACIEKADAQIITLALRRANEGGLANILDYIPDDVTLLPNTSGARNAKEAVRIARLSRELGCGDFVKVEVVHDSKYLLPDNYETIKATEILAKEGFVVMPYMYPDLNAARALVDAGAACIMPLGAPIGSNKGLCTKEFIQILIDEMELPIIVDAGIGRPSQACEAMEMGAAAVMILFANAKVWRLISIFIPVRVLIKERTSAPPASAARAISVMSVTFGLSFIITGCFACFFTSLVIASTAFGSCPKAIPPSLTFGQEILISNISTRFSCPRHSTTSR